MVAVSEKLARRKWFRGAAVSAALGSAALLAACAQEAPPPPPPTQVQMAPAPAPAPPPAPVPPARG